MSGVLDGPDATIETGDAVEVVRRLKAESDVPLCSRGSLAKNRSLMAAGLVDRVQLTIFPVISGQTCTGRSSRTPRTSTSSCWRAGRWTVALSS